MIYDIADNWWGNELLPWPFEMFFLSQFLMPSERQPVSVKYTTKQTSPRIIKHITYISVVTSFLQGEVFFYHIERSFSFKTDVD